MGRFSDEQYRRFTRWSSVSLAGIFIIAIPVLMYVDENWHRYVISALCALSIWGWWTALRSMQKRDALTERDVALMMSIWNVVLIGNGLGSLYFYDGWFYYDLTLHFVFPFLAAEFFFIAFNGIAMRRQDMLPKGWAQRSTVIALVVSMVVGCIIGWEIIEWFLDTVFGTTMLGQVGDPYDTYSDIIAGFLGVALAALLERREHMRVFEERTPQEGK